MQLADCFLSVSFDAMLSKIRLQIVRVVVA